MNIVDAGDLRKYRTEIPNSVDDMGLTVYAFRLYAHLKRVAGDSGECFQGKRKMAEICGMSPGMITNAKRELAERGLIEITPGSVQESRPDTIIIIDIWRQNFGMFSKHDPGHDMTSPGHDMTSPGHDVDGAGHEVNGKKEPSKNNPGKKIDDDETRPSTVFDSPAGHVFESWQDNIPGTLTPILKDSIFDLFDECGETACLYGIKIAVENNARNFNYVATCARNHAAGKEPPGKPVYQRNGNGKGPKPDATPDQRRKYAVEL